MTKTIKETATYQEYKDIKINDTSVDNQPFEINHSEVKLSGATEDMTLTANLKA